MNARLVKKGGAATASLRKVLSLVCGLGGEVESRGQLGRVSEPFLTSPCNEQVLSAGGND